MKAISEQQLEAINRFPDQNPNPVMRVSRDGELIYANEASEAILSGVRLRVGEPLPEGMLDDLRRAAGSRGTVEVRTGTQTFALLPVHVPELDFMHLYGTDITAAKVVAKFPDENPNPVLRINAEATLIYANAASAGIVSALGVTIGEQIPSQVKDRLERACAGELVDPIEVQHEGRTYTLKPVLVEEFGFTNIYGTDVTATKAVDKFPNQNPNPVLRTSREGRLTYANPASELVRKALRAEVGGDLPREFFDRIQGMVQSDARGTLEMEADGHIFRAARGIGL